MGEKVITITNLARYDAKLKQFLAEAITSAKQG